MTPAFEWKLPYLILSWSTNKEFGYFNGTLSFNLFNVVMYFFPSLVQQAHPWHLPCSTTAFHLSRSWVRRMLIINCLRSLRTQSLNRFLGRSLGFISPGESLCSVLKVLLTPFYGLATSNLWILIKDVMLIPSYSAYNSVFPLPPRAVFTRKSYNGPTQFCFNLFTKQSIANLFTVQVSPTLHHPNFVDWLTNLLFKILFKAASALFPALLLLDLPFSSRSSLTVVHRGLHWLVTVETRD